MTQLINNQATADLLAALDRAELTTAQLMDAAAILNQTKRDLSPASQEYLQTDKTHRRVLDVLAARARTKQAHNPTDHEQVIRTAEDAALAEATRQQSDRDRLSVLERRHQRLTKSLPDDDPRRVFDQEQWLSDPAEAEQATLGD